MTSWHRAFQKSKGQDIGACTFSKPRIVVNVQTVFRRRSDQERPEGEEQEEQGEQDQEGEGGEEVSNTLINVNFLLT